MADEHADLLRTAAGATIAAAIVLVSPLPDVIRATAGVPLLLFLPGYALNRALFDHMAGATERAVMSLALSISVAIAGGLLLNLCNVPLASGSWALWLLLATLAACAVAVRRGAPPGPSRSSWPAPRIQDVAVIGAALIVALGGIALGRTPLGPPDGVRGYTELSQVRTARTIELRVTAKELRTARYRLELRADRQLVRRWRTPALDAGEGWTKAIPISSLRRADVLEARLYRPASSIPYRRVRLDLRHRRSPSKRGEA